MGKTPPTLMIVMTLIIAFLIFASGKALDDCEQADGTLVRGWIWFQCVEKGEHPHGQS